MPGIAIVTGASSGMGAEFCRSLDSEGLECIWLVARRADRLEAVASELKTPSRVITTDLSGHEGVDSLLSIVASEKPDIRFLVNCAGLGKFGKTWEVPAEDTRSMVGLNVSALVDITNGCIPLMRKGSSIIEVCSASAYMPLAELNVYSASKAFVRAYCEGLRQELDGTGISLIEVSPGWVGTEFIALSQSSDSVPEKVFKHTVTSERVVADAMRDLKKGRKRSVCGPYNKLQVFLCRHMPAIASRVWRNSLR
ncbi:MAG: SDR family NAD(P)-dependent oxidoreductase [Thermoplasmata archaeon]|nr:SDR family NAD(P)-dependent oxidoreductase [Thermoplasmata archaeon]